MAAIDIHCTSGEQALASGKTVLQIVAAAQHRVRVKGFGISIKGTSSTDPPVLFQVFRQTTAGTMTAGTTGTNIAKKDNSGAETLQTAVQVNATVEPTAGDLLFSQEVHPQTGFYYLMPMGQEFIVPGGGRLGLKVTSASLTYSCTCEADIEE